MTHPYKAYIHDLASIIREKANKSISIESCSDFESGRALAYAEILSIMQNQADSFEIPRNKIGLDGFDPMCDFVNSEVNKKAK